ncbi:MAG: ribonuclease P protein subunit [Candidatus Micrarchaeota archaeon]
MDKLMLEEWIGKNAKVVGASNPALIGLSGRVIDETLRTVSIDTPSGPKLVPKDGTTFEIASEGGHPVLIEGSDALVRPHERSKKLYKKIR